MIETMQDSLLELTESFPLFAHYVWRLMAILEAYEFSNNVEEESIWAPPSQQNPQPRNTSEIRVH